MGSNYKAKLTWNPLKTRESMQLNDKTIYREVTILLQVLTQKTNGISPKSMLTSWFILKKSPILSQADSFEEEFH